MTRDDEPQHDTLPPAIVEALRDLDGPAVLPDAQRDADVLSGARRHLAPARRKRRNRRLFVGGAAGGALAAAAMVGVVVMLGDPLGTSHSEVAADMAMQGAVPTIDEATPSSPQTPATRQADLDANGVVDILDAYALARRLERGDTTDGPDLDGDGRTDQRDVDWIANHAVALNRGEQG